MKKYLLCLPLAAALALSLPACKDKKKSETTETTTTTTPTTTQAAPVEISADQELQNNLPAATKDFPGVNYTVNNGEVTLTGSIERDRLPKLMQSVQALHPKKVNNQLTIK
ncbi:MAG: hypothetical protein EOO16_05285 [Chitinophagaceae bacterium]|nr:MAG: hypothetical protein EOO16_05285 [Chitinophagaceae bacterium]